MGNRLFDRGDVYLGRICFGFHHADLLRRAARELVVVDSLGDLDAASRRHLVEVLAAADDCFQPTDGDVL